MINQIKYRNILSGLIEQLHDDELRDGYFQQDNAPPHVTLNTLSYIREFYDDRVISKDLYPARSPDLTPCDCFLFGHLKNVIYKNRPATLEDLQQAKLLKSVI